MKSIQICSAVALGTGLILAAPPAWADSDSVVIAINPQTGASSTDYGPEPISQTLQDAVARCNQKYGPGCVPAGSATGGCVGVAMGYAGHFEAAQGSTIQAAEAAARARLVGDGSSATGGEPELSAACSNGDSDGFSSS